MKKITVFMMVGVLCLIFALSVSAHSGRTDSKGGHYNHTTNEYHYHHGYPEHQHINGECPYQQNNIEETYETHEEETYETPEKETGFIFFLKSVLSGVLGGGIFGGICWSAVMVVYLAFNQVDEKADKFSNISAWIIIPLFMIGFFIYSISN